MLITWISAWMTQRLKLKVEPKDWRNPANIVTLIRLALAWMPAAFILATPKGSGWWWVAAAVFAIVAATDVLDGRLARREDKITGKTRVTDLGKFLDPLVDKVLVATTLVALCLVTPILWFPTGFIALREIWVAAALRKPAQKAGGVIAAVFSGKAKMVAQCLMIVILMIPGGGEWPTVQFWAVIVTIVVTIWSWIDYQVRFGQRKG